MRKACGGRCCRWDMEQGREGVGVQEPRFHYTPQSAREPLGYQNCKLGFLAIWHENQVLRALHPTVRSNFYE